MEEISYKKIQEIEISATKKLLNYISKELQREDVLDKLEFYFPDLGEYKHKLAFNIWVSIDFVGPDGKTFVEKFIKEKSSGLTKEEKTVLIERNKSKVSLFEVLEPDGEYVQVFDIFQKTIHRLWEPELVSVLSIGDYIFGRVGSLLGQKTFIGDINYLPLSTKDMFLEEVLFDFNQIRLKSPELTMEEYLKKYSINLYRAYTNSIFEAIEIEEDIASVVYEEIDEFQSYIHQESSSMKKHVSNLMDFFEYYLADEELTLYDLDQVDFDYFFQNAIDDGFIVTQEDINSYISTFKKYLLFLSSKDSSYKESYNELLDISKARFHYMSKLKMVKSPFLIDKEFSNSISNYLNEDAISIIMDYDKFLLYILDNNLSLTEKNKFIKRKNLLEINKILETSSYPNKKFPSQKDFPIINIFYNISLRLELTSINGNELSVTDKGLNYLRLRDEDKFTLFFQYIWDKDFILKNSNIDNTKSLEKVKKDLVLLLSSLDEDKNYEISTILSKFTNSPKFFFSYYIYLQYLGIIRCSLYPSYEIKVTPLGKKVIKLIKDRTNEKKKCPVIQLDNYIKGS